eukprot:CAMPEP_0178451456 /NCGR_PEP_ID=MMETSP0689_2-20121128/43699_1 /TAXON_ID=160604 /ORGANISM="Amphidinium massartii, Strain CS-259" /LENGTH=172 /DNA_ID=CAMNT_0020077053 /DNA_START=63 /DNA_END=578 /DNA_ORIENTATION=+
MATLVALFEKVLEANPDLVKSKRILELGAGRGLVGVSAAYLGASQCVLTDLSYALPGLEQTLQINTSSLNSSDSGESPAVVAAEFDWARPQDFLQDYAGGAFDVVLAADATWLLELVPLLVGAIAAIGEHSPDVEVLIMHQTRASNVDEELLRLLSETPFQLVWQLRGGRQG